MQALILAAGAGRRMSPLSDVCHKGLLPVAGRPILDWIVDGLSSQGVVRIGVVTGYRSRQVEQHLSNTYPELEFTFVHNDLWETTNNIVSISVALEQLTVDDDLLLVECDVVFENAVLRRLIESPHPNVAAVDHFRVGMDGTVVDVGGDGIITAVHPGARQDDDFDLRSRFKTLNLYKFSAAFCNHTFRPLARFYADSFDEGAFYEVVLGMLIYLGHTPIHAAVLEGEQWMEIDTPPDLRTAEVIFNDGHRRQILDGSWGGFWGQRDLDFAFIRNMHFPPPSMVSELRTALPALLATYGSSQSDLNEKMAWWLRCRPERVVALSGASQAYPWLALAFAGRSVAIPDPTFGEYPRIFGSALRYADSAAADPDELAALASSVELLVVVNPNNPSGLTVRTEDLLEVARRAPGCHLLIDESFLAFSDQPSAIQSLDDGSLTNITVLTSLSKTVGAPGVRLGHLYSTDQKLLETLRDQIPIWGMNSVAEFFLEAMMKRRDALAESVERTKQDRADFRAALGALPVVTAVSESGGNYLLTSLDATCSEADALVNWLSAERRILVKDVSDRYGSGKLRIAVRTSEDNQLFCSALSDAVAVVAPVGLPTSRGDGDR